MERRRYVVSPTAADRRWTNRPQECGLVLTRSRTWGNRGCRREAILWLVGPRGGIIGQWCDQHGRAAYQALGYHRTSTLRDAEYMDRGTDEELAMWAIGNGPDVRPWYGPASRTSAP